MAPAVGKLLTPPLLVFNLLAAGLILGLAAWYKDHTLGVHEIQIFGGVRGGSIDDRVILSSSVDKGFEGSKATPDLVQFSLIAGVVAVASYIVGLHNVRKWTLPSAAAAQAAAWIAFLLLMLPFALVWKEISLNVHRGNDLIVLESFVIILTVSHFVYTLLLYSGDK